MSARDSASPATLQSPSNDEAEESTCPVCGSATTPLVRFGPLPSPLDFRERPGERLPMRELALWCCTRCGFVFIPSVVSPDHFYGDQQATTSTYPAEHLPTILDDVARRHVGSTALIVEVGCNDGYLLDRFRQAGYSNLLGVEPSPACAALVRQRGIEVRCGFFSAAEAEHILRTKGPPAVVLCRHVLEHTARPAVFIEQLARLVRGSGLLVLEVPDLETVADRGDISALWEQHLGYFDAHVLRVLLNQAGLRPEAFERFPHGGGSLLTYAVSGASDNVYATVPDRRELAIRLERTRHDIRDTLGGLRRKGKTLAAFGAGMRGVMLLNLCGAGSMIDYIVDDSPQKIGRYLPGSTCPVVSASALMDRPTDYCLILPLSSKRREAHVMERLSEYRRRGGRFIEFFSEAGHAVTVREEADWDGC